jgi:AhpD family alkylhydroperoxidase
MQVGHESPFHTSLERPPTSVIVPVLFTIQSRDPRHPNKEIKILRKEHFMQPRLNYTQVSPGAYKAMLGLEEYLHKSGLEESLLHLIKLRASQINGCAYCLDMHWKDLRAIGEDEQRMYSLDAWQECPYYTERERAALAWTEAGTLVAEDHVPDKVHEAVRPHFSEKELCDVTLAVAAINAWNRLSIAARTVPRTYKAPQRQQLKTGT